MQFAVRKPCFGAELAITTFHSIGNYLFLRDSKAMIPKLKYGEDWDCAWYFDHTHLPDLSKNVQTP